MNVPGGKVGGGNTSPGPGGAVPGAPGVAGAGRGDRGEAGLSAPGPVGGGSDSDMIIQQQVTDVMYKV